MVLDEIFGVIDWLDDIAEKLDKRFNRNNFGSSWGLNGNYKKSEARAVVGAISNDSDFQIGLTAMQLDNLGYGYGKFSVQLDNENPVKVSVYNTFGEGSLIGNRVWISRGLAERMELIKGNLIMIRRVLDEQGKIRNTCKGQKNNPFGRGWDVIEQPTIGIVAAIDEDGNNKELYRVGLSAMQMCNLCTERKSRPLDAQSVTRTIKASERGLLDGQDYGSLIVDFDGGKASAQVYNAFGMRAIGGCGIRVSSTLAGGLGLKLEDRVKLYTNGR